MAVPKPNIRWRGAHPNNFTVGRPGASRDGRKTDHHVVGSRESAVIVFNQSNRGASAHFVCGGDVIDQCVDINNTAWSDGNWDSNLRTISIEHEGGQNGNGPYSDAMYANAAHLTAWLRENYGVSRFIRHREVKQTACPGGLDCERIWRESTALINRYNQPPAQPEWMRNRKPVGQKTVYAQKAGIFVHNLTSPGTPLDSRRFVLNQDFLIKGETTVAGKQFWITVSSYDNNTPSGILKEDVADSPYKPPVTQPPKPTTPEWADALIRNDKENRELYVLRATPLIDLENGHPYVKDGKEVWYSAGDIVKDVSSHTIVNEVTYEVTEYSLGNVKKGDYKNANGIKASDLTTDPKATPPGTPANPELPPKPTDPVTPMPDVPNNEQVVSFLEMLVKLITDFLAKFKK